MLKSSKKFFKINDDISAQEVRVIDESGVMVGIISLNSAIEMAKKVSLDLIEVSPNVKPPVCKIASFGKMKYELQKKANDSKKKQKTISTKEIKMGINIGKSDYDIKVKSILKFIQKGDKVKVSVRMRGREMNFSELADKIMFNIIEDTAEIAKYEYPPKMEGRQTTVTLVPK